MSGFRLLFATILAVLCCAVLLQTTHAQSRDVTIDAVTLLLPSHVCSNKLQPVKRLVKAHGGCFRWHSSSPHIVTVDSQPGKDSRCVVNGQVGSTEAMVSVVYDESLVDGRDSTLYNSRRSAWIWAEDISTGRRAECEVFIDRIHSLLIATSTRRINVGDTEVLQLQAFDEHGDVFSTLEGLPFEWSNTHNQIAHGISFTNANVNVSSVRLALEQIGHGTDVLPIIGSRLGRTTFSAKFTCHDLPQPVVTTVDMLVTEPLAISPTLLRMCPSTQYHLQLSTRQHKNYLNNTSDGGSHLRPITLPSVHYKWGSDDSSIASMDPNLGVVTTHKPGYTKLFVTDVTLNERAVSSDVIVTMPHRLEVLIYRHLPRENMTHITSSSSNPMLQNELQRVLQNDGIISQESLLYHQVYHNALPRCGGESSNVYHLSPNQTYTARVLVLDQQNRIIDVCDQLSASFVGDSITFESTSMIGSSGRKALPTGSTSSTAVGDKSKPSTITLGSNGIFHFNTNVLSPGTSSTANTITLSLHDMISLKSGDNAGNSVPATISTSYNIHIQPPPRVKSYPSLLLPIAPNGCQVQVEAEAGSGRYLWLQTDTPSTQIVTLQGAGKNILPSKTGGRTSGLSAFDGNSIQVQSTANEGLTHVTIYDQCNPDASFVLPIEASIPAQVGSYPHSAELMVNTPSHVVYQVSDVHGRVFTTSHCLQLSTTVEQGDVTTNSKGGNRGNTTKPTTVLTISTPHAVYHPYCDVTIEQQQLKDPSNTHSIVPVPNQLPYLFSSYTTTKGDSKDRTISITADSSPLYGCYTVSLHPSHVGFARVTISLSDYYQNRLAQYWTNYLKENPNAAKSLGITSSNKFSYALSLYQKKTTPSPYPYHYPVASQVYSVYSPLKFTQPMIVGAINTPITIRWTGGPLPYPEHGFLPSGTSSSVFGYDNCIHVTSTTTVASEQKKKQQQHVVSTPVASCLPLSYDEQRQVALSSRPASNTVALYHPTNIYTINAHSTNKHNNKSIADVVMITSSFNNTATHKQQQQQQIDGGSDGSLSIHEITVTCIDHHPTHGVNVTLSTSNHPSLYNPYPHLDTTVLPVRCYPQICPEQTEHFVSVGEKWKMPLRAHPLASKFKYTSENNNIASVDEEGNITGNALGVTIIHITVDGEHHYGLSTYIVIHVIFNGFIISGEPTIRQHQHHVYNVQGSQGELPTHQSFKYVNVEWYMAKGHHASLPVTATTMERLTNDQKQMIYQVIGQSHGQPTMFQPITSSPVIGAGVNNGDDHGSYYPASSIVSSSSSSSSPLSSSSSLNLSLHGVSLRVGSSATGPSTLVAKITTTYPPPGDRVLQHIQQHPPQCGGTISISPHGYVQEYFITRQIQVIPTMVLLSPSTLLLPPGSTMQIQTNLDHFTEMKLNYQVLPSLALLPSPSATSVSAHKNVTNTSVSPVAIHSKGQIIVNTKDIDNKNYDAVIVLDANHANSTDTSVVNVHIRPPSSLDLLPDQSPSSSTSSPSSIASINTATSVGKSTRGNDEAFVGDLAHRANNVNGYMSPSGDFTQRSRFLLFSDLTGSSADSTSLLQALCPPPSSSSSLRNLHTMLDTINAHNIELSSYSLPPSNFTMGLVLRDALGQIFDSVQLHSNKKGTIRIDVDGDHSDTVSVYPQYIHPSYDVTGVPVGSGAKSSKHTSSQSKAGKTSTSSSSSGSTSGAGQHNKPGSDGRSSSPIVYSALSSSLATLTFAVNNQALLTGQSQIVTIKVTIDVSDWSEPVQPIYLQFRIGSKQDCSTIFSTPPALRIAVPLSRGDITGLPAGSNAFPILTASSSPSSSHNDLVHNQYMNELRHRIQLTTKLAVRDAVLTKASLYFGNYPTKQEVTMSIPEYHHFIRSIDTFAGYALVDVIPQYDVTEYTTTTPSTLHHLHQWQWTRHATIADPSDVITLTHVSAIDVALALVKRFNVTLPTIARSSHAAQHLPSYTTAPNLALSGNEPSFPYRTSQDKLCSSHVDFTLPIYVEITPIDQAFAILTTTRMASTHKKPVSSVNTVAVHRHADTNHVHDKSLNSTQQQILPTAVYKLIPDIVTAHPVQSATSSSSSLSTFIWPFASAPAVQFSSSRDHTAFTLTCLNLFDTIRPISIYGQTILPPTSSVSGNALSGNTLVVGADDKIGRPFLSTTNPPGVPLWLTTLNENRWTHQLHVDHDLCVQIMQTVSDASSKVWSHALSTRFHTITRQQQQYYEHLYAVSQGVLASSMPGQAGGTANSITSSSSNTSSPVDTDTSNGVRMTILFTLIALLTGAAILYTNFVSAKQDNSLPRVQSHQIASPNKYQQSQRIFYDYDADATQ